MPKIKVANVNEVSEGELKLVDVNGAAVVLYKINGEILATTNVCPHEDCLLSENHMMHGDVVECTCHGSQFNVKTGANVLPPAAEPLKTYNVSVEGGEVYIEQ